MLGRCIFLTLFFPLLDCQFKLFGQHGQKYFVALLPSCEIWSDCNTSNHAPSCGLVLALFFQPSDIGRCSHMPTPVLVLALFFQPSDIVFRAALVCISSAVYLPAKESVYIQKKRKNRLLPCYQWLKGLLFVAFVVTKYKS